MRLRHAAEIEDGPWRMFKWARGGGFGVEDSGHNDATRGRGGGPARGSGARALQSPKSNSNSEKRKERSEKREERREKRGKREERREERDAARTPEGRVARGAVPESVDGSGLDAVPHVKVAKEGDDGALELVPRPTETAVSARVVVHGPWISRRRVCR